MKYLFLICFLLPLCAFSQKSYLHLYGGYSPKSHNGAALFGFSAGGKLNRSLALGGGVSVPVANFKTNLMIGVAHYTFISTVPGIKLKQNQDRLTFTLGFLL